jgi:hypothetical protein
MRAEFTAPEYRDGTVPVALKGSDGFSFCVKQTPEMIRRSHVQV